MSALSDWQNATPYSAPFPQSTFPILAFLLLLSGFIVTSAFSVISSKTSLIKEFSTAIPASLLLGFGTLFLFMAVGIYV
ncbi:7209_t:CDS:2 [Entrophospora sp. SA101]|nr:11410_t:CDS:2 [Entrophospora candida]CAG8564165.1 3440_t:CDS:2 [Entrophospora candida]CAJ0648333.1 7209_t:CDS:2 [Entrophospora sp. SA101]